MTKYRSRDSTSLTKVKKEVLYMVKPVYGSVKVHTSDIVRIETIHNTPGMCLNIC